MNNIDISYNECKDFFLEIEMNINGYSNYIQDNYKLLKQNILLYDNNIKNIKLLNNKTLLNDFFLNFEKQMLNYILIFKQIINIKIKNNILELIYNNRKKNFNYIKLYI
jgi:hypothetical protein